MTNFALGKVVMTRGISDLMVTQVVTITDLVTLIKRHSDGDWGNISITDQRLNDSAIQHGDRILSSYTIDNHTFWVITEADRSYTTLLLPEEY